MVRDGDPLRYLVLARLAMARGQPAAALPLLRTYRDKNGCISCGLLEIGEAFDAQNQPDSAAAVYLQLATQPESGPGSRQFDLPPALRRLGELAESKGDKAKAVEYYSRLLDLWRNAEPELQPQIAQVRKRVAELVGEAKN